MHEWKGWIWECGVIVYFHGKIEDAQIRYICFFHQTKINQNASLCGGFCSFDWKESRHICWGFLFSFCPQNWCHKSILLIINPQGHERGGPCQNIKISSWACHSLSLSYIDYLGSRLCRLHQMYTGQFSSTEKLVQNWHIIFLCTGGPLLTLFFKTLEKHPCKQKTV